MKRSLTILACLAVLAPLAAADILQVEIIGEVEYNQVNFGVLDPVAPGDAVLIQFLVDSEVFLDSGTYPTRGYVIDQSSFSLMIGAVTTGLQDPFPAGETPYFVLRNNDPAVDGFFLSRGVDFPNGVPLNIPANLDPYFTQQFQVGYTGDTIASLDIIDAIGTYTYDGLTNFYFTINDGGFEPLGLVFTQMTISAQSVAVENRNWSRVKALFD